MSLLALMTTHDDCFMPADLSPAVELLLLDQTTDLCPNCGPVKKACNSRHTGSTDSSSCRLHVAKLFSHVLQALSISHVDQHCTAAVARHQTQFFATKTSVPLLVCMTWDPGNLKKLKPALQQDLVFCACRLPSYGIVCHDSFEHSAQSVMNIARMPYLVTA